MDGVALILCPVFHVLVYESTKQQAFCLRIYLSLEWYLSFTCLLMYVDNPTPFFAHCFITDTSCLPGAV